MGVPPDPLEFVAGGPCGIVENRKAITGSIIGGIK